MKKYKVQWAYAVDIGTPVVHRDEAMARGEVAHLLGTRIRRNLTDYLKRLEEDPGRHPEFREGLRSFLPQLQQLIGSGNVWTAYELWEDFYLHFENEFDSPLYVIVGAVFVEGTPETGLKNRIPLLERMDVSPMEKYNKGPTQVINRLDNLKMLMIEELIPVIRNKADLKGIKITDKDFVNAIESAERAVSRKYHYMDEESEAKYLAELREGILRKIFPKLSGPGLGAFKRWSVQYADFGGKRHASIHTNEDMAKGQTKEYLSWLLHHLSSVASMEAHVDRNIDFAMAAEEVDAKVRQLLKEDHVWAAYLQYKEFEEIWNDSIGMFPLTMSIGSMRVVPEPEPES